MAGQDAVYISSEHRICETGKDQLSTLQAYIFLKRILLKLWWWWWWCQMLEYTVFNWKTSKRIARDEGRPQPFGESQWQVIFYIPILPCVMCLSSWNLYCFFTDTEKFTYFSGIDKSRKFRHLLRHASHALFMLPIRTCTLLRFCLCYLISIGMELFLTLNSIRTILVNLTTDKLAKLVTVQCLYAVCIFFMELIFML